MYLDTIFIAKMLEMINALKDLYPIILYNKNKCIVLPCPLQSFRIVKSYEVPEKAFLF